MRPSSGPGSLGDVIRRRRLEFGWSQEELAARVGAQGDDVRQSDISRLELGKVGLPRRSRLERIAAALDMPLGELLARSGWAAGGPIAIGGFEPPPPIEPDVPRAEAVARRDAVRVSSGATTGSSQKGTVIRLQDAMAEARVTMSRSAAALDRARQVYDRAARPPGPRRRPTTGGEGA